MSFSLLTTLHRRAATFFTKVSADTLWKSVTSCRAGGRKKGRLRALKKPKDLNKGQGLGEGTINMIWPGLNAPIIDSGKTVEHKYIKPDPLRTERILAYRKESMLIGRTRTLHPMERGWSGRSLQGRKLESQPYLPADFTTTCLRSDFATVMVPKGRSRYHSVLLAAGNGKGLLGFGFGYTKDPKLSMIVALRDVNKRMQFIHRLHDHTVFHDFYAQCCGVRIFVQRKPKGFGLRCHRVIEALCKLSGITDLHAKVDGNTSNYMNICKAFVIGLLNQETHQELAERKRLHVVEFKRENGYLPKIVASPRANKLRLEEELDKNEVLDVEEMYDEGKLPYNKPTFAKPFYITTKCPTYRRKLYLEHPYRNFYNVKLRLMAEGVLEDGSKEARTEEAERSHKKVMMGEKPLPIGLGLPGVYRESFVDNK